MSALCNSVLSRAGTLPRRRQNQPMRLYNRASDDSLDTLSDKVRKRRKRLVLFLLATIVSLAVLAKKNQYLPRTDPGRHISTISKMDQGHREALVSPSILQDSAHR